MYKKAFKILCITPAAFEISKAALGIPGELPSDAWLWEEKEYLEGLEKEPPEETSHMEYYQRLNHFWNCECISLLLCSSDYLLTDIFTEHCKMLS